MCLSRGGGLLTPSLVRRGRRFESVRGLCKSPAKRDFSFRIIYLRIVQLDAGMEHIMGLPRLGVP